MQSHVLYTNFLEIDSVDTVVVKKVVSWEEGYILYILIYKEHVSDLTIILSIGFPILLLVHIKY